MARPLVLDASSVGRTTLVGAASGLIGQGVTTVAGFFATALIARNADVQDVGVYVSALAISTLITLVLGLQLNLQIARARDSEVYSILRWCGPAGICASAGALASALLFWNSTTTTVLGVLALACLIQPSVDGLTGILLQRRQVIEMTLQTVIRAVARPVALLALLALPGKLTAVHLAILEVLVVGVSLSALLLRHGISTFLHCWNLSELKRGSRRGVLIASAGLLASTASWQLIQRTDLLAIKYFLGAEYAGKYAFNLKFFESVLAIYAATLTLGIPLLALAAHDKARSRNTYLINTWISSVVILPILAVLSTYGQSLAATLFGDGYALDTDVVFVISLGMMLHCGFGPTGMAMVASRRTRGLISAGVVAIALNLALNIWLVQSHGILGGALASAISLTILNLLYAFELRHIGLSPRFFIRVWLVQSLYILMLLAVTWLPGWILEFPPEVELVSTLIGTAVLAATYGGLALTRTRGIQRTATHLEREAR